MKPEWRSGGPLSSGAHGSSAFMAALAGVPAVISGVTAKQEKGKVCGGRWLVVFYDGVGAALPMPPVKRSRRQGRDQEVCAFRVLWKLKTGSLKHVGLSVPWNLNNNDHSSFAFRDLAKWHRERGGEWECERDEEDFYFHRSQPSIIFHSFAWSPGFWIHLLWLTNKIPFYPDASLFLL